MVPGGGGGSCQVVHSLERVSGQEALVWGSVGSVGSWSRGLVGSGDSLSGEGWARWLVVRGLGQVVHCLGRVGSGDS